MKIKKVENTQVGPSRAGDVFHYRWAARRCLKLIQPNSNLESILIEKSKELGLPGELVIDVSEYYQDAETKKKRLEYYQLKHTSKPNPKPFTFSRLQHTIVQFAKRYSQLVRDDFSNEVTYTIITNRKIDDTLKQNIDSIANETLERSNKFYKNIKDCTNLDHDQLSQFCGFLRFNDSEGSYLEQEEHLRIEMSRLQPGFVEIAQVDSLVSLVQKKVLPNSNGEILKEEVLKIFGASEDQLFPAKPEFENIDNITYRKQYSNLLDVINSENQPIVIQAEGGVGKSVFSQYVVKGLPEDSFGVAYDCFGSGKYRSRSKPRHRHRDALVQIANELAAQGFCNPIIPKDSTLNSDIISDFLKRIDRSIKCLKKISKSAKLYILIDAADNAEMAAKEVGESCFAHELLCEDIPLDCKLVYLCRPGERTQLLKPSGSTKILKISGFTREETFENLKKYFQEVNENQALEFHRLTSGNPRVQMNAITAGHANINELLEYLGPYGTSVEQQIEDQLNAAVNKIKDNLTSDYQTSVDRICKGLASLPPNIPLEVLANASEVSIEDVKSFMIDIGRSLWMRDSTSVHFRDEPTETWFRNTFLSSEEDFRSYVKVLEPLASDYTYVAEILPQIYLQAGQYDDLIEIALSDKLLPDSNPLDKRNVLVYRLQFAFKAALRSAKYKDAIQLALRAGEEVAGDHRQQSLFQNNIDLLPKLQSDLKVQEIAFKKILRSSWEGSENVYTASLLSEIKDFKGEAQSYLRSAMNWLHVYFEDSKKEKDKYRRNGVSHEDILEMAYAFLNLNGAKSCLKFLNSIKPKEFIFQVVRQLVERLIDADRFDEIDQILKNAVENKFYVVAIVSELARVGRFAEADDIEKCLQMLANSKKRIKKPKDPFHDNLTPSIVAFLEVCLHRGMKDSLIARTLDYYVPKIASQGAGLRYESKERIIFLKALSIRCVLSKVSDINLDDLMPRVYTSEDKKRNYTDDIKEFKEVIGGLYPWYLLRAQLISGDIGNLAEKANQANEDSKSAYSGRYRSYDFLHNEIASVTYSILVNSNKHKPEVILQYFTVFLKENSSFTIHQRIDLLRTGNRVSHLNGVLPEIESSTYELIKGLTDAGPEEIADSYISLARAVLSSSKHDAAVYFEDAIDIVSKFGDEIVERWEAVQSLGERSAPQASDELAYRFIRCVELVGEYVHREKHWDRSRAIVTCTKMSPQIGISALSRWRDREIGRFEYHLEDILSWLVKSKVINPTVGWSMARLFSSHHLIDFLSNCLNNESSHKSRINIFNDAYYLVRKQGADSEYWVKMKSIANEFQISNEELDKVLNFYKSQTKREKPIKKIQQKNTNTKLDSKKWERIFHNVEILDPEGFATLIERYSGEFDKDDSFGFCRSGYLFNEVLNRIKADELYKFIDLLSSTENVSHYDFQKVLGSIPDHWRNKVSFKKKWPKIINEFGVKYAYDLINDYSYRSAVRELEVDDDLAKELRKGIFQGLSQGQEFTNASILFNFVRHASSFIDTSQASELTDYALSRFELHIEDDFGDGSWNEWLFVSNDENRNIAGFIWSALGSPHSETRWKACHTVKKLADFSCTKVLNSLIEWMEHDQVDAFGSNKFPFYNLHARQYLLLALCRVSIDNPEILVDYKEKFQKYSQMEPHVLIQKFASETALNIEKAIPGTYSSGETFSFEGVGRSKCKARNEEYGYRIDSYLHQSGEVDTGIDHHFGWDFDQYWYKPLGEVFGVPSKQVQELCANVIVKEWSHETKSGYNNDPRVGLWNRDNDRKTWHDHGRYPKTDNWDFYLSYHSMLVVAAKLVENMPVVSSRDYLDEEDAWDYWLSRHCLTRIDGKWLSDSRGELPLQRPDWISKESKKDELWRVDIQELDYLKSIKVQREEEMWLNIKGGWTERHNSRYETYSVSSSLVSKATSVALMRALTTTSDYRDYKLPDYEERSVEIDSGIFKLRGFILDAYESKGIDKLDPYSGSISYPPFSFGEPFNKLLNITPDVEGQKWFSHDGQIVLECDIWSSERQDYDKEPEQSGIRISASLELLKRLCKVYDSHMIIDINISRDIEYNYRSDKEEYQYLTHHKIYLFTPDGRLRSISKNYRLR
ncbi:ATP-binding protein [Marinoscillum furvescens]|uniref:Nephrocystin 3-like N-terminal domain-containing protein n=1 Tax=Marinoscillum furvescens DSM 4134 TaxID=1122208 RepID=A0A3D9KXE5_MARFU|nr:ATP-binding protein [Marinoscillum furvescens]RED92435.1 hypothetical protein C7460_1303 [Marinoscillum furvescens DSM 4134]